MAQYQETSSSFQRDSHFRLPVTWRAVIKSAISKWSEMNTTQYNDLYKSRSAYHLERKHESALSFLLMAKLGLDFQPSCS